MRIPKADKFNFLVVIKSISFLFLFMFCQNLQADWQPFTLQNGSIVIDVELAGQPAKAILDSGATVNFISKEFVEKLGKDIQKSQKMHMQGVFGEEKMQGYSAIPITLFGSEVMLNNAVSGALGGYDVLLGGGFFTNVIVQIDYPKSRIRLLDKKAVDMKKAANVPMKRMRGSAFPAIQVEANNEKVWLIFDTGNSGGIFLNRSFALANKWLTEDTEITQQVGQGLIESGSLQGFHLDTLKIGPYELENVSVNVPAEGQEAFIGRHRTQKQTGTRIKTGTKTKGLIGYDVFKHFVITVDYTAYKVNFHAP